MDAEFWKKRWQNNQIGFHQSQVNPYLVHHITRLGLPEQARIFVPLCGKTLDIGWLLEQNLRVCAAELSVIAIEQLFASLNLPYQILTKGSLQHYQAQHLDVYVGDIFNLDQSILGEIDGVYDRAALVALPHNMRIQYVQHVIRLTHAAPQLLINYSYDQTQFEGPPFSISDTELLQLYQSYSTKQLLETEILTHDNLNQRMSESGIIHEKVWLFK